MLIPKVDQQSTKRGRGKSRDCVSDLFYRAVFERKKYFLENYIIYTLAIIISFINYSLF